MEEGDKEFNEKKELLKTEIIDKKYDLDKFIQYCIGKKENGDDLSLWTIPELKDIIKEFVSNEEKEKKKSEKSNQDTIEKEIEELSVKNEELENKVLSSKKIECKKLLKTKLNEQENLKIIIKNPKSIETGILSSNYVTYDIETELMKWCVQRRFSDFEWLSNTLIKLFPGYIIPPIPKKKMGKKRFELEFIEKRMNFLQKFLDLIIENEEFKASDCLIDFLSISDRNKFEAKMKEFNSLNPSPFITESRNIEGNVYIWDVNEKKNYFDNIENFYKIENELFGHLNSHLKEYLENIEKVIKNLNDIQKDYEMLNVINKKVLMKKTITQNFDQLGIFIKNWSRIVIKQKDSFKNNFKNFFKFKKLENNSIIDLLERRNIIKNKFFNDNNKLQAKMEKLFQTGDINKFEIDDLNKIDKDKLKDKNYAFTIMCTKENTSLNELKNQLGYYNMMCFNELIKKQEKDTVKYMDNLKNFTKNFYPTLTDGINVYSTLQIFINTIV